MYLSTFPDVRVHAFDICEHGYTPGNAAILNERAGRRLMLTCGDSALTVPQSRGSLPLFDFFMVDGDHSYQHAFEDIVNAATSTRPGGKIVVDDCDHNEVRKAWNDAVKTGVVQPWHEGL